MHDIFLDTTNLGALSPAEYSVGKHRLNVRRDDGEAEGGRRRGNTVLGVGSFNTVRFVAGINLSALQLCGLTDEGETWAHLLHSITSNL